MCATFTPAKPAAVQRMAGQRLAGDYPAQAFPGYAAPIFKPAPPGHDGAAMGMVATIALFGLIPPWAKDATFGRHTYNARAETVAEKPSFRQAWRQSQLCLVPMAEFFEPCWETGRAVQWRIQASDAEPFTVAAIWDQWMDKSIGRAAQSFSMLTINADGHPLMGRFHRPADEKRSLVVVPKEARAAWLAASPANARDFLVPMPCEGFISAPVPQIGVSGSLF